MTTWDPDQYERFKTYRDRPAIDLMVQIPDDLRPREIWDLGCGTGEHAALLKKRHPGATVHGLDTSEAMLAVARKRPDQVDWVLGSVEDFAPSTPPNLLFSNAALQWAGGHETLFPRLVSSLAPGGVFACQMPITYETPWHEALREVAAAGPWAPRLADIRGVNPLLPEAAYYDLLAPLADVDLWSTVYLHVLEGEQPVVEWMKGTGLRPYLDGCATEAEEAAFLAAYGAKLAAIMPPRADGATLVPFPRLFMVARRSARLANKIAKGAV